MLSLTALRLSLIPKPYTKFSYSLSLRSMPMPWHYEQVYLHLAAHPKYLIQSISVETFLLDTLSMLHVRSISRVLILVLVVALNQDLHARPMYRM